MRNCCNLIGIWTVMSAGSDWKLVTFDLDRWLWELFLYHSSSGCTVRVALPSNIVFGLVINFQNIWITVQFKVMGPRSRSRQWKNWSMQLKNYWSETAGVWSEYLLVRTFCQLVARPFWLSHTEYEPDSSRGSPSLGASNGRGAGKNLASESSFTRGQLLPAQHGKLCFVAFCGKAIWTLELSGLSVTNELRVCTAEL